MSRSRRGGRPLGSRSRLSRSLIAAAALHREEPGETEDEEVKRTDGHLVGSDGDPNSSLARSSGKYDRRKIITEIVKLSCRTPTHVLRGISCERFSTASTMMQ